jgi:hypothetical protein
MTMLLYILSLLALLAVSVLGAIFLLAGSVRKDDGKPYSNDN